MVSCKRLICSQGADDVLMSRLTKVTGPVGYDLSLQTGYFVKSQCENQLKW